MKNPDQSKENKELAERVLDNLIGLFEDWSNEVPEKILHGEGKYKVRINWWNGLTGWFNVILIKGLVKNEEGLKERIKGFLDTYSGRDYWQHGHKHTTKKDIVIANNVLKDVIGALKSQI